MTTEPDIIYTKVDEAPELASGSFLPIIQAFAGTAGVNVGTKDISLAGRIISQFPEWLKPEQQQPDDLALLGEIVMTPESNVIKLPNISASLPQIKGCVEELQSQGYNIPDYPEEPKNDEEKDRFNNWIPIESFRVDYFLTVDGISTPLVLLTGILGIVAVFASWNITFCHTS